MTIFAWPAALGARGVAFNQRGMAIAGPPTLTGQAQVGSIDAGFWIATLDLATITKGAAVLAFRALRAKLEGGVHQVRVPVFDGGDDDNGQIPWPAPGGRTANAYPEQPHSDGTFHTDGHGFFKPKIIVASSADAALRSTSLSATVTTAGAIAEGTFFSISDRLHVIHEILAPSGGARTWAIWPPLRTAVPAGTRLDFENPVCRMARLAKEDEMDLALGRLWSASPSVAFVEEFRG